MKNGKLMAILKLVLTLLVAAGIGYFIMQEPEIEYKVKKSQTATEEQADESEDSNEDSADETENAEDVNSETEPETQTEAEPETHSEEEIASDTEDTEDTETADENGDTADEVADSEDDEYETKTFKNYLSYKNIDLGLDLAGGVSVVYEAETEDAPSEEEMASAIALLRTRLTLKGHTEAEVSGQGDKKIRVEMPGVEDPQEAVSEIGQTAELKFYGVNSNEYMAYPVSTEGGATSYILINTNATSEEDMQMYTGANIDQIGELLVSGTNIADAYATRQQTSNIGGTEPVVVLEFDSKGTTDFANGTKEYLNNYIAIALDTTLISVPNVGVEIVNGEAIITGMGSIEEAQSLANLIKSGSLPFKLDTVETNIIGARLGSDALTTSVRAGFIGLVLVAIFMICFYAFPGFVADLALAIYVVLIMAVLALFNVTLTLPGIAGIILSIGMAVDANVIIFTRIKEELSLGKTISASIEAGFEKAKSAILDGNITTLIIAAILYAKGIGSIRGFAQTLALGIVVSMFTALVITKFILRLFVAMGIKSPKLYGVFKSKEVTATELNKKHGKKE